MNTNSYVEATFHRALAALALMCAGSIATAATTSVALLDGRTLSIEIQASRVQVRIAPSTAVAAMLGEAVALDGPTARELRRADEVIAVGGRAFVQRKRNYAVIGVTVPSVAKRGGGFCGAGTEDFLLLLEARGLPRRLELRDRLQVQSCLQSMVLRSVRGSDLSQILRDVDDPAAVPLAWLQHPRFGPATRTLIVAAGKFALAP